MVAQKRAAHATAPECLSVPLPLGPCRQRSVFLPFVLAFHHMMIGAAVHLDAQTRCKSTTVARCGTGARSTKCPVILPPGSNRGKESQKAAFRSCAACSPRVDLAAARNSPTAIDGLHPGGVTRVRSS